MDALTRTGTPPVDSPGCRGNFRQLPAPFGTPRHFPAAAGTFRQVPGPNVVAMDIDAELAARFYPDPPASVPPYDRALAARLREDRRRDGNNLRFYRSAAWRRVRAEVLGSMHMESLLELSGSPARVARADTVHHILRLDRYPGYALHPWALDGEGRVVRNLIPLTHAAHDLVHGRRFAGGQTKAPLLTPERW